MRLSRALCQAAKKTTGIWGIPVVENPRPQLIALYNETLKLIKDKIPETAVYRQSVEAITRHRLNVVEKHEDVETIESLLNGGQIEELIMAAKDELELVAKVAEWKAWEPLEEPAPPGQWVYAHKIENS
ncbi:hypothetical protein EV182_002893 [Spiromyces aspiralis]|uniref:Uncharacterized protein n=1 Tax=Spiromyces aspiralis TaxID=68401 RepID=A0ACC1HSK9_9FUNG|nr:hypothetical protein EV182_002893 [Spiromyces aspiralis]